ncbi:MAG: alcohol dehydrogenase catalytic domain-containing protein, partial [Enterococcus hulanensis]
MKTAVFYGIKDLKIEECDLPEVSENKILIKIEACAICTWEQRVYTGVKKVEYPFIGGHEIAAEIVALGSNIDKTKWQVGDKVVFGTNLACGECDFCKSGEEQNCLDFNHSKQLEGLP